jgi:hypothetical protein
MNRNYVSELVYLNVAAYHAVPAQPCLCSKFRFQMEASPYNSIPTGIVSSRHDTLLNKKRQPEQFFPECQ